MLKIALLWKKS